MIAYDPSLQSLLHPEATPTLFRSGQTYTVTQIGAEMAHLAYYSFEEKDFSRLQEAVGRAGFGELRGFSKQLDTQAFVAIRNDGLAVVAFRGTQPGSIEDIGVDASVSLVPWRGDGHVHQGFRDSFESVRADIDDWMTTTGVKPDRLLVCGHSLGGALATLAGAWWKPAHLVTIGSPRVGDIAFSASAGGPRCQRIFDCCDLVARVPPRALGYDHAEPSFFIAADGLIMPNPGPERIDAERHIGRGEYFLQYAQFGNAPVRDLADHAPTNYLRSLFP